MHSPSPLRVALCVEQALLRDCLGSGLEAHGGFLVTGQYGDARRFLTQLDLDRPAVAVVDVMGEEGGRLPLLRETCQFHPDLKVLALTDGSNSEFIDACFQSGAAGCLDARASQLGGFLEALQAVARGQRVFPGQFFETLLHPRNPGENAAASVLGGLSAREREVLTFLAAGADNLKIASLLRISERTVKAHVSSLYRKLGQENRTQLALHARQLGIRPPAEV
jgi:DNA-binding NarL/FixJ family response regulator